MAVSRFFLMNGSPSSDIVDAIAFLRGGGGGGGGGDVGVAHS